jgi:hypothetical protein
MSEEIETDGMDNRKLSELVSKAPTKSIPINQIEFDVDNPRIQFLIDSEVAAGKKLNEITQIDIRFGLRRLTKGKFEALKESIETSGLLEAIWVYEKAPNLYVVIEGNTRKLVFHELSEKYPRSDEWKKIEARVLPQSTSEESIVFIRLESHLGGKQPWAPYERARYLYNLSVKGYPKARIASEARTTQTEITNDLKAFEIMQKQFLANYGDSTENPIRKYNYFVELVGKKKVRELVMTKKFSIEDFCKWVAEQRIPRAIDVRDLPEIFSDDEVAELFKNKGYEVAMDLLGTIKPNAVSPLFRDIEKVIEQLEQLKHYEIQQIREGETAKQDALNRLIKVSSSVLSSS